MGSPERVRSSKKREIEEDIEVNIDIVRDDDEWIGDDSKRKQRLSKSRQLGSGDDVDGLDGSGKRRSTLDRHESRKRAGGSSRADSDQDDYGSRRESRSKQAKKKQEESTLDVLSSWYQDGDAENKLDVGDKPGSGGHSRAEESERKKSSSKYPEQDADMEKDPDRDSRDVVKKDLGREKAHGFAEHGRSHRRRWDEPEDIGRTSQYGEKSDGRSGKPSDIELDSANEREKSDPLQSESNDTKSRGFDPVNEKSMRSNDRDERRVDSERKNRGRSEFLEEDGRGNLGRDDTPNKERLQEHRQQRNPTRDTLENYGRSSNADEDVGSWGRDRSRRDVENSTSKTPEKIGRRQSDVDNSDMDHERSATARRKELGKDGSSDDRSKGRDDTWSDRSWDRENAKDTWKRKQDKEARDNDPTYDGIRDWELPRRGRDRIDGRSGGRKDGNRTEAVKTSSKYGISNENYDVIEIQTKPFDYAREDSRSRNADVIQEGEEFTYSREERSRNVQESAQSSDDTKDRSVDGDLPIQDQNVWKDDNDFQGEKSRGPKPIFSNRGTGSQSSSGGSLAPPGSQEAGSYGRSASQGNRGSRVGRGGRGRPGGRDNQQAGIPGPLAVSNFGPLGLPPPGPMQSLPPNMSPAPGPISPGVFIPSFQAPILWPGARGVDMSMLGVPPGLPPVPPSPLGPRFSPNLGNVPNGALMFNPSGPGRGMPPGISAPNFNAITPAGRGQPQDKASGGWNPPRINAPPGKAPSRGEQNDYSQNFVDTGMRPQNFIRELELTSVVEDYPKLRELIQKKDEIVSKSASPPMYYKCDLREQVLSPEFFGTKFDVILVDPPWEEYVHRAPGVTDHTDHWTFEEIMNLKIEVSCFFFWTFIFVVMRFCNA